MVEKLAVDKHWRVRQAVGRNPRASDKLLGTLMADRNEQVAMTAKLYLGWRRKEQLGTQEGDR